MGSRLVAIVALASLLASCVTLTQEPRALLFRPGGAVDVRALPCSSTVERASARIGQTQALDPHAIRILTWNIHKQGDSGWARDLSGFARVSDIVLLQEVTLRDSLRSVVEDANLGWVMASSFLYGAYDIGVMTASRIAPLASCTQRVVEPLIRLPKSAIISWFRLTGSEQTLAVVNVHAINFSLSLETYREQFAALGEALDAHRGPIIFAGDFNTWTQGRSRAVSDVASRLGLTEIEFADDRRSLFFGKQLDHILIRGLEMTESQAIPVTSSDHNPVAATLRVSSRQ